MRVIGNIEGSSAAQRFVDYTYVQGVECRADHGSGDQFEILVYEEDQFQAAQAMLNEFVLNPGDPKFAAQASKAASLRQSKLEDEERYRERVKGRGEMINTLNRAGSGKLTLGLIGVCIAVFVLMNLSDHLWNRIFFTLSISNFRVGGGGVGLPEVLQGQIWRLVTPILMHGSFLHIFFNLWWLKDLGGVLEWRLGWRPVSILVMVIATGSNLAQYYVSGPAFLGISGVVFGLLGFIWMKGKHDPNFGIQLPQVVVFMMLLWLVLGYTGTLERGVGLRIANTAHSAGLVMGMLCAFLPYWDGTRR